jgi:hypothetical protein
MLLEKVIFGWVVTIRDIDLIFLFLNRKKKSIAPP